jgi:Uma2 family endonuclease
MATGTEIGEQEFWELVLADEDGFWELWQGVPRQKPQMSMRHNAIALYLGVALANQLAWCDYRINVNGDRARVSSRSCYIPDVIVIPADYQLPYENDPSALGVYPEPLPLVVEVWSPTNDHYDVATKLRGYQERGDLEIWYIHPGERTLTAWRKQPDGGYENTLYRSGVIPVASHPGVAVDLEQVFDGQRQGKAQMPIADSR